MGTRTGRLQCIVCRTWEVSTHSNQTSKNFKCSEFCREFHRKYDRRSDGEIRKEFQTQVKDHQSWKQFCL